MAVLNFSAPWLQGKGKMISYVIFILGVVSSPSDCVVRQSQQSWVPLKDPTVSQSSENGVSESLHNIMPYEEVQYSIANVSSNYHSSTKFYAKGMGHLYYLTNLIINTIQEDQAFPEGLISVSEDGRSIQVADARKEWKTLLTHYGPVLGVILGALVFIIVMPIAGLLFCCCRCAGKCGSRSQPFEKRYDPCRRHSYGILLAGITVLISFGVVCAFVTNEFFQDGLKNLPRNVRTSLDDVDLYINNTKLEINNLLIVNFNELDHTLNNILQASGQIVKDKLGKVSKASVLVNLTNIVSGLGIIKNDLREIDNLTKALQDNALQLDQALKETRSNIIEKLQQCKSERVCREFLKKYHDLHDLTLEANFTQLPDVTASLQNVSELMKDDIEHEVLKGKREFEKIQVSIQNEVQSTIPQISDNIRRAGDAIKRAADKITQLLDRFRTEIHTHTPQHVNKGEFYITEYGEYKYYLGLGVSVALLMVLMSLTMGLFCGFCGARPDGGYQDDCCNKGSGARCLMLGVWLMFLSSAVLMAITLAHFMTGITVQKTVCEPLHAPDNSRIFALFDKILNVKDIYPRRPDELTPHLNISTVIRSCHRNESIYQVLDLEGLVDMEQVRHYAEKFEIMRKIQDLTTQIRLNNKINILTEEAKTQLFHLAHSPLSNIDFPAYTHVLGEKITSIDLMQLAGALNETSTKLPDSHAEVKRFLRNQVMYLHLHQSQHVASMLQLSKQLEATAHQLSVHLKFNHTSLKDAIEHLMLDVEDAQTFLDNEGPSIVQKLAKDFGEEFTRHINQYLERVVTLTTKEIGHCWPLSQVYNATIVSGCNKMLLPFNGFWVSSGSILLLFIPAIILSVILASLYQKSDPYPGPLVEAEYLYDAYSDHRENIPLAHVREKKKKKTKRSNHETYDNGAAADYSAHLGRGSRADNRTSTSNTSASPVATNSAPDSRFAGDMAPKHWDFPNSALPHYTTPPPMGTEYERPPPYYYPGPVPVTAPPAK